MNAISGWLWGVWLTAGWAGAGGCEAGGVAAPSDGDIARADTPAELADGGDLGPEVAPFVPAPLPSLPAPGGTDQPVYVFLFTHTEDPFNHTLSEARYTTTAPLLQDLAADYPETHPEWTIQFQGADAKTIADRHGDGGLVAYLRGLAGSGLIHFGYHGHHDPTYLNRPQKALTAASSLAEIATAFDNWVSCERDLPTGNCVTRDVGGIVQIQETFGDIQVYSGLSAGDEGTGPFEDGGGNWAVRRRAPEVRLAFGFSDHAPEVPNFEDLVMELLALLSPSGETSGGVYWADDMLRINDGDWRDDVHLSSIDEGAAAIAERLADLDTSRIRVFNGGIASKFIYAARSPTQWGYSHPTAPALLPADTLPTTQIAKNYALMDEGLRFLAGTLMPAHPGSRFIGPDELLAIAAPADLFEVTAAELDVIARWVLLAWTERPPNYLSDGHEFYSLRDAIGLLARALAAGSRPATQTMTRFYGPEDAVDATTPVTLSAAEVQSLATAIAGTATASVSGAWTSTPPNLLPSRFTVGARTVTTAQAL